MKNEIYDLIVIGAGSGGLSCAIRAAKHGARVVLIDDGELGGTCVNVGCVPKKVTWLAAELAASMRVARDFGFNDADAALDWNHFIARREGYIANIHESYRRQLADLSVEHVHARGRLLGEGGVSAGGREFSASKIVIATGGKPLRPDLPGADLGIDSNGFFELREAPARVAIIGGGYIAVELAGVLNALGSKVSMIVRESRVLKAFDAESAMHLGGLYQAHGIQGYYKASVSSLAFENGELLVLGIATPKTGFDCVIWATGRVPNTFGLGLDVAGVACDDRGHIKISALQETSVEGIFALGDASTDLALTPVAVKAGRTLAERLFNAKKGARYDRDCIPTVVFSHPPIASVGLSEETAREIFGDETRVYCSRFRPMRNAIAGSDDQTLMKLVCSGDDERVVGIHLVGDDVDEMLQGFALAMKLGASKADFDDAMAIHPTAAEELLLMR